MSDFQSDEFKVALHEYLAKHLTLEVSTTSEYTGGMDGGDLYKDCHTLRLVLAGDVISEVSL